MEGKPSRSRRVSNKTYVKPVIVYREKVEARAAGCAKADAGACSAGPIQS